jgi:LCP family protein required for cell wall assembly
VKPPPEERPPRVQWGMWKRFIPAALVIFLCAAGATATFGFLEVHEVAEALEGGTELKIDDELVDADPGEPQTIMLLGSDLRYADRIAGAKGNSDTMMLVRLDPDRGVTTVLSIPRDLKVEIPGHGTDKINAAYSIGGAKLALKTVKRNLGIDVNHVIDVNFGAFRSAVDFVGCVYVDIDRRYFNDNSGPEPDYATIDIKPGYQKLCGQDALDYVRYRHTDNDLVRAARQQDFLKQVKQQVGVQGLLSDRKKLARLLGKYTATDIRGDSEVMAVLKLVAFAAGKSVREVQFRAILPEPDDPYQYVTITPEQLRQTRKRFLGSGPGESRRGGVEPTPAERKAAQKRPKQPQAAAGLEDASQFGREQAELLQPRVPFPVYYPRLRTQLAVYEGDPRAYNIRGTDGKKYRAYRMVIKKGLVGEYYGVQGMNWKNPPILANPSEKRTINGREYELFYDGRKLTIVAFRTDKAVYWLTNTLTQTLSNKQMLAIAESMRTL